MYYVYFIEDGKEIVQQFRTPLAAEMAMLKAQREGLKAEMRTGEK